MDRHSALHPSVSDCRDTGAAGPSPPPPLPCGWFTYLHNSLLCLQCAQERGQGRPGAARQGQQPPSEHSSGLAKGCTCRLQDCALHQLHQDPHWKRCIAYASWQASGVTRQDKGGWGGCKNIRGIGSSWPDCWLVTPAVPDPLHPQPPAAEWVACTAFVDRRHHSRRSPHQHTTLCYTRAG